MFSLTILQSLSLLLAILQSLSLLLAILQSLSLTAYLLVHRAVRHCWCSPYHVIRLFAKLRPMKVFLKLLLSEPARPPLAVHCTTGPAHTRSRARFKQEQAFDVWGIFEQTTRTVSSLLSSVTACSNTASHDVAAKASTVSVACTASDMIYDHDYCE